MTIDAFKGIVITDDDIDEIELLLGNVKFDTQRRDILKSMDSINIQAYPGSGKTTVLIAKLAILAKKWPYSDRGICVLSYTNVARNEIETRIGSVGEVLLSFPHFVGTFHSFFDNFVALPWLRANGYPITTINTDIAYGKRYKCLNPDTQIKIKNKCSDYLEYNIIISTKRITDIKAANFYNDIFSNVALSLRNGYFTFDEILYFSKCALSRCKYLPAAIQERFPLLLIDEAQDTNEQQWKLIDSCFSNVNTSVRQTFGDANQAIFQSCGSKEVGASTLQTNCLKISNSHRFGSAIARLADPLGVTFDGLNGDLLTFERLGKRNVVFLFDKATDVLPAYAKYLLSCFSDDEINGNLDCYAVGLVHKQEAKCAQMSYAKYPWGIIDYYNTYDPEITKQTYIPRYFIDFYTLGQRLFIKTNNYYSFIDNIASGLRKYINDNDEINIPNVGEAFNLLLNAIPENKRNAFRADLMTLINFSKITKEIWSDVVKIVEILLKKYFDMENLNEDFFQWIELPQSDNSGVEQSREKNVFFYQDQESKRTIKIHLSSIHGVKGQTHLATLVLDTFWYKRNIRSILDYLRNEKFDKYITMRLKCHYVALTRARGLVCIAVPKSSISYSDKEFLTNMGWQIMEL